jgi:hypothetical protein
MRVHRFGYFWFNSCCLKMHAIKLGCPNCRSNPLDVLLVLLSSSSTRPRGELQENHSKFGLFRFVNSIAVLDRVCSVWRCFRPNSVVGQICLNIATRGTGCE